MAKIKLSMSEPTLVSESAFTPANVADLRTIHSRMLELTERAERIIRKSDEVFPAAASGWLRNMKAALGLLNVKNGSTLEDTIQFCQRLVESGDKK